MVTATCEVCGHQSWMDRAKTKGGKNLYRLPMYWLATSMGEACSVTCYHRLMARKKCASKSKTTPTAKTPT